jgi:twitching motility protein PilT
MQTFDQSLFGLFKSGFITYEEALRRSSNPDDFALKIRGVSSTSDLSWDDGSSATTAPPKEPEFKIDRLGD